MASQRATSGIYFLANDIVKEWFIACSESIRAHGCTLPICIIPFDEKIFEIQKLAPKYGAEIWQDSKLAELDGIGTQFFPGSYGRIRMFRKLACFWGPFEYFMYSDLDLIALMNWDEILLAFPDSNLDFVYFGKSSGNVFLTAYSNDILYKESHQFNSGAFVSSRGLFSLKEFHSFANSVAPRATELFCRSADQPFLNYCIDHSDVSVGSISELIPNVYDWNWARSSYLGRNDIYKVADRTGSFNGRRFPFIHWAGFKQHSSMPNYELFLKYRLRNSSVGERLRYEWAFRIRLVFENIKKLNTKFSRPSGSQKKSF